MLSIPVSQLLELCRLLSAAVSGRRADTAADQARVLAKLKALAGLLRDKARAVWEYRQALARVPAEASALAGRLEVGVHACALRAVLQTAGDGNDSERRICQYASVLQPEPELRRCLPAIVPLLSLSLCLCFAQLRA